MFRPITYAPRGRMSHSLATLSASLARGAAMCQPCSSRPLFPRGCSRLWSGPATKPSSEIDMWQVVSGTANPPEWLRCASGRADGSSAGSSGRGVGVLHRGGEGLGALLRRGRVHPHDLPAVAVEVEEAARVHEAVVLGAICLAAACRERSAADRIHLIARRHAEAIQRQRVRGGIGDRQLGELRELLAAEQHDEGVLTNRHASGGLVGEHRVVAEPELREERLAALEVRYEDVHEQHAAGMCGTGHAGSPLGGSTAYVLVDRLSRRNSSADLAFEPISETPDERTLRY